MRELFPVARLTWSREFCEKWAGALKSSLHNTKVGSAQLIFVRGPAAVGKTQVVVTFLQQLQQHFYGRQAVSNSPVVLYPGASLLPPRKSWLERLTESEDVLQYDFTFWLNAKTRQSFRHDTRALAVALGSGDHGKMGRGKLELFIRNKLAMLPNFLLI